MALGVSRGRRQGGNELERNWNRNCELERASRDGNPSSLDDGESATAQPPQKTAVGKVRQAGTLDRYSCAGIFS